MPTAGVAAHQSELTGIVILAARITTGYTATPSRTPDSSLQDERPRAVGFLDAVDGGDVRVVQAGQDLRLPLEPGEAVGISRESVGEDLQGDIAVELRVGGLPDLAHAAFADEGGHVVVAETGADGQGHELCWRERAILPAGGGWLQPLHRMASPAGDRFLAGRCFRAALTQAAGVPAPMLNKCGAVSEKCPGKQGSSQSHVGAGSGDGLRSWTIVRRTKFSCDRRRSGV